MAVRLQWELDRTAYGGYVVTRSIPEYGFWKAYKWWPDCHYWYYERHPEWFSDMDWWGVECIGSVKESTKPIRYEPEDDKFAAVLGGTP